MVRSDRYCGSCNTLSDLSNEVSVPNETGITGINKLKILPKDTPCKCKCRFDGKHVSIYCYLIKY